MKFNLVDTEQIFVGSTHVKACTNSKKKCGSGLHMNRHFGMKKNCRRKSQKTGKHMERSH